MNRPSAVLPTNKGIAQPSPLNNAQAIYRRRAHIEDLRSLVLYIGSPMRCTTLSNPQASPTSWLTTTTIHHGDSLFLSNSKVNSHPLVRRHLPQDMLCTQMASIIPATTLSPIHLFNTTTRIQFLITLHHRTLMLISHIFSLKSLQPPPS